jgi:hypothetical protein
MESYSNHANVAKRFKPNPESPAKAKPEYDEIKGPLGGLSVVVSGVFENITREKLEEFVKKNGGKLQGGVNPATSYMVVGKLLDDGRAVTEGKKYQKAVELGIKIVTEKEFEQVCRQRFDNPDFILGRKRAKDTTASSFDYFAGADSAKKDALAGIDDISELLTEVGDTKEIKLPMKRAREEIGRSQNVKAKTTVEPGMLWTDKYAPRN